MIATEESRNAHIFVSVRPTTTTKSTSTIPRVKQWTNFQHFNNDKFSTKPVDGGGFRMFKILMFMNSWILPMQRIPGSTHEDAVRLSYIEEKWLDMLHLLGTVHTLSFRHGHLMRMAACMHVHTTKTDTVHNIATRIAIKWWPLRRELSVV